MQRNLADLALRSRGGDVHVGRDRPHLETHGRVDDLVGGRDHDGPRRFGEADARDDQQVRARRGRLDLVAAVGAGLHGRFTAGGDVAEHDAGARHDGAGGVRHDTGHGGGERRAGSENRREEETDKCA